MSGRNPEHSGTTNGHPQDEQKAKVLAFLLLSEIKDNRCTLEDLSTACLVFSAPAAEIRRLCKLPNVPLRLLDDERIVELSKSFDIRLSSLVRLLHNQANDYGTGSPKHVLDSPVLRKAASVVPEPRAVRECTLQGPDFDGLNTVQLEPAGTETRNHVDRSIELLRIANGPATNGSEEYNHNEIPSRKFNLPVAHPGNLDNALPGVKQLRLAAHDGFVCDRLGGLETVHLENPSNIIQRPEQIPLGIAAQCLAEQGHVPLLNEINVQPKKKPRESRPVPHFEDYNVDGEVGAGGYGTVYKVRRKSDGQVFAMKCPLENTHDSNVRNEIRMLKRLRGRNYIIQIQNEVTGKVSPKPDTGGVDKVDCPSILLEFIEHDKPEILKKEITIDELKCYSVSLFKALAQLHKERVLHLDVKPGNFVFSRSTRRGCLVDFNLARDESARRLSTRRPERAPSRAVTTEARMLERLKSSKRPLDHEAKPCGDVKPSKRSRQIRQCFETKQGNMPSVMGQRKVASKGPLNVKESGDNAGNVPKPPQKNQETLIKDLADSGHRLAKRLIGITSENTNPSTAPFTKQSGEIINCNQNKRVGCPPLALAVQPSNAKRAKLTLKLKAPCHQLKDAPCVGTKGYRAPEVLMRSTRQTTKVDIWSAGVSLLQLVTGRSPFPSTSTDGALKDIAKLRGSLAIDNLAKSLGRRPRVSKGHTYPGVSVKEWSDRNSRRTDLKGRIPSTLYDLIEKCLDVNPDSRITAEAALLHQFCSVDDGTAEFSKDPTHS